MYYMLFLSYSTTVIFCTHCLYARAPSFFLTHLLGRFLTTLDLHVPILDMLFYYSGVR